MLKTENNETKNIGPLSAEPLYAWKANKGYVTFKFDPENSNALPAAYIALITENILGNTTIVGAVMIKTAEAKHKEHQGAAERFIKGCTLFDELTKVNKVELTYLLTLKQTPDEQTAFYLIQETIENRLKVG